jgi:hypothetical protein
MDGLCKGVNGVRASGPNYPPFSGRSKLAAPKVPYVLNITATPPARNQSALAVKLGN